MSITEDTDLHPIVLKRHYIEIAGTKWEVSTVRLVKDPTNIGEAARVLVDIIDDVHWHYETMIFKYINGERDPPDKPGAASYGRYRSNDSQDIVKAHDQIVSLIAEGKLTPVECKEHSTQISSHIVTAMVKESKEQEER